MLNIGHQMEDVMNTRGALRNIRDYLENNGFRFCCYINGDAVIVDLPGEEFTIRNVAQARWLVRHR